MKNPNPSGCLLIVPWRNFFLTIYAFIMRTEKPSVTKLSYCQSAQDLGLGFAKEIGFKPALRQKGTFTRL